MQQEEIRSCCDRCGDTKNRLYTRKVAGGWLRHCHNENCYALDAFLPDKSTSPKATMERLEIIKSTWYKDSLTDTVKTIRLPRDFNIRIPQAPLLWLQKYGILQSEIESFGIGWSDTYQRLILPVYQDERLIYWQGRTFKPISKSNPKYLNIRQSGAKNVFFRRNNLARTGNSCSINTSILCIVEDILSAIKVGRYSHSLALLGSYIPKSITTIIKGYTTVNLWLDRDKYTTAIKQAKRLNELTGIPIRIISTEKDPKECTDEQIKRAMY